MLLATPSSPLAGEIRELEALFRWFDRLHEVTDGTFTLEEHDVLGTDDHVIALSHMSAVRDGVRVSVNVVSVFHFRDGRQQERWFHPADLAARHLLGLGTLALASDVHTIARWRVRRIAASAAGGGSMMPKAVIAALAAIAMTSLVACSSEEPSTEGQGSQVAATLHDYSIETSVTSVPAGKVTFNVENVGATEHEMVVIRTDLDPSAIPVENHEADEEASGMTPIGEVEDVQPGESKELQISLESGRYLLICNIRKHFEKGMVTEFQVA